MNCTKDSRRHEVLQEAWLEEIAASFTYPRTPDVADRVRRRLAQSWPVVAGRRRLAWAAAIVFFLLASLLAAPQVRAALGEILSVGAMTIFVEEEGEATLQASPPDASPAEAVPEATAAPAEAPAAIAGTAPPTATDRLAATQTPAIIPATPVSLTAAREMVEAPLRLPAYPEELGAPDSVYVDHREHPAVVVFVWYSPARPDQPRLSLYQIRGTNFGSKLVEQVAETTVNGRRALWIEGPHLFQLADGSFQPWQFVRGPVLLWTEGRITYRLEGAPSLEEAVRIAESLTATNEQ